MKEWLLGAAKPEGKEFKIELDVLLRHFEIAELSLASYLHIELTPSLFDEKTR